MKSSLAHRILLVHVTMLLTYSIWSRQWLSSILRTVPFMCHIIQLKTRLSKLSTLAITALGLNLLDLFLVLIHLHLLLLLVHHLLEELLHLLKQHIPHLDHLPHVGERLPKARKPSWTLLLKAFLLASICVARTPRRSVRWGTSQVGEEANGNHGQSWSSLLSSSWA